MRRNENPGAAETDKWVGHVRRIWLVIIICSACVASMYKYFYISLSLLPFSLSSLFTVRFTCVDIVRAYIDFRNARVQRAFGYYRRCYTVIIGNVIGTGLRIFLLLVSK